MSRLLLSYGKKIEIPLDIGKPMYDDMDIEDYGADEEGDHKLEIDIIDNLRIKPNKEKQ